jgi:hypothetical protein
VLCYIWMNLYWHGGELRTHDSWLCCSCHGRSKAFPGFSLKPEVTGAWIEVWWCVNRSDRRKKKYTPEQNRRYIAASRLDFLLFSRYLWMRQNLYLWEYCPETYGKEGKNNSSILRFKSPAAFIYAYSPMFLFFASLIDIISVSLKLLYETFKL